jgi:hypothetical protein
MLYSTSTMQYLQLLLLILTTQHFIITSLSEKCNPHDKKALLQIKSELGNPTQLSSWNPTTDCCERDKWLGIVCDSHTKTYRVDKLDLYNLDLPKPLPIPPSIFTNLPFLNTLSIDYIPNLVGPIPTSTANLTKLQYFLISFTNISGEIPNTLSQIKTLVDIIFSYNKLICPLPDMLSSLPNLGVIIFDGNKLIGAILESYGSFSNSLTLLSLTQNRLSGKIPASLVKLNLILVALLV